MWLGLSGAAWAASSRKSESADSYQSAESQDPFFIFMILVSAAAAYSTVRGFRSGKEWFKRGVPGVLSGAGMGWLAGAMASKMLGLDQISSMYAVPWAALFGSMAGAFNNYAPKPENVSLQKDIADPPKADPNAPLRYTLRPPPR